MVGSPLPDEAGADHPPANCYQHVFTSACPIDCLRIVLSTATFQALARAEPAPFEPPVTVGQVIELLRAGRLGLAVGLGPRRLSEIRAGLVLAGVAPMESGPRRLRDHNPEFRSGVDVAVHQRAPRAARQPNTSDKTSYLALGSYDSAVPCGRLHTRFVLHEWGLASAADDAELIVSELLTNAVKATAVHGLDPCIALGVAVLANHLLLEVWDPVSDRPELHRSALDADYGRGLAIVALLSEQWGTYQVNEGGKVVWAAITLESAGP
jgi:hypothetical protein